MQENVRAAVIGRDESEPPAFLQPPFDWVSDAQHEEVITIAAIKWLPLSAENPDE